MPSILKRSLVPILVLGILGVTLFAAPVQAAPHQVEPGVSGASWWSDWLPTWLQGFFGPFGDTSGSGTLDTAADEPGRIFDRNGAILDPDGVPTVEEQRRETRSLTGWGG
ncbi:MAG: hypothetical protein PVG07_12440 [Acidobacteriota bacterium]|jgi:hypothetical protein